MSLAKKDVNPPQGFAQKCWAVIDRPFYVGVTCQPQIVVKRFEFSSLKDPSP